MNPQINPFLSSLLKEIVFGLLDNDGSFILPKREMSVFYWNMRLINITNMNLR